MRRLILGVDGGNTKTVALVADADGTIIGSGRAGCSDIYNAESAEAALGEIEKAVAAALEMAGVERRQITAGGFNLAGADWPEDFDFFRRELTARGLGGKKTVVNDALGALRANAPGGIGVVAVCGTGIAIGSRGADGRMWHGSFWLENAGSDSLSWAVVRAVNRAELGIDGPTSLTGRVLAFFGKGSPEDALHHLTAREHGPQPRFRELARVLLDEAQQGDTTALGIVEHYGTIIGEYILAAARKVFPTPQPFALVLAGGVFRHPSSCLPDVVLAEVNRAGARPRMLRAEHEPAIGALLFGFDAAGIGAGRAELARLAETSPPAEFFHTLSMD